MLSKPLTTTTSNLAAAAGPCTGTTGLPTAPQCIYAIGGWDGSQILRTVESYDPARPSDGWSLPTPDGLADGRFNLGATTAPCPYTSDRASDKQCVYALGGTEETSYQGDISTGVVEVFDPHDPGWELAGVASGNLNSPLEGMGVATAPCPNTNQSPYATLCIFAIGGVDLLGLNGVGGDPGSVEYWQPQPSTTSTWTTVRGVFGYGIGYLGSASGACPGSSGLVSAQACLYAVGGMQSPTCGFNCGTPLDGVEMDVSPEAPAVTSPARYGFATGNRDSFLVTTVGYPAPGFTVSLPKSWPSGLTVSDNGNGTATLSGDPTAEWNGTYKIGLEVKNGALPNGYQSFSLIIGNPPKFTTAAKATFRVGKNNTFRVSTAGVPTPLLSDGGLKLPRGLKFNILKGGSAKLTGDPRSAAVGKHLITLSADNGIDPIAIQQFILKIRR